MWPGHVLALVGPGRERRADAGILAKGGLSAFSSCGQGVEDAGVGDGPTRDSCNAKRSEKFSPSSAASCSRAELQVHQIADEPQRIGVGGWSNCSQVPVQFSDLSFPEGVASQGPPFRGPQRLATAGRLFYLSPFAAIA